MTPHTHVCPSGKAKRRFVGLRRAVVAAVIGLVLTSTPTAFNMAAAAPNEQLSMVVFLPTRTRPRALQDMLEAELKGVNITVYGRYRDFERAVDSSSPDAVMALAPVLEARNMRPEVRGALKGATTASYVLVSVEGTRLDETRELTIGVIDILGRHAMSDFVMHLLGVSTKPALKLVSKVEDLLHLLHLRAVDAVIAARSDYDTFRSTTEATLVAKELQHGQVGLPAVHFNTEIGRRQIGRALRGLGMEVNNKMGVEEWRGL